MKITRLHKIIDHRAFSSFNWTTGLHDFGRFNLVYGWNGAGKTTLSNLFRNIERKEAITEGTVEFHLDGQPCPGSTLNSVPVPNVRVFNKTFVEASVFSINQEVSPIYFLGKDSAEKQKEIEALKAERIKEEQQLTVAQAAKTRAIKAFEEFSIGEAKTIKELLSSSGANPYNNYDKARFKTAATRLLKQTPRPPSLSELEKASLKKQKEAAPKEKLIAINTDAYRVVELTEEVAALLKKTVSSQILAELQNDAAISEWVQQGLGHHSGENHTDTCRFCGSAIPAERISRLQAHFNDAFNLFLNEIDAVFGRVEALESLVENNPIPLKAAFYDHLESNWDGLKNKFDEKGKETRTTLGKLKEALSAKRKTPFGPIQWDEPTVSGPDSLQTVVVSINDLIEKHNGATANIAQVVSEARTKLENGLVTEALASFQEKQEAVSGAITGIETHQVNIESLNGKIVALEREVLEHRRPADELNTELRSYLGRDELQFSLQGNGYRITRSGLPAVNLSEGERSAIAFLYFLKALRAKDFDLPAGIVVIDDPVSSLDANAIFCAFGCMKEAVKEAGQVFILTHNFTFFRQVKNWFNYLPNQRKPDINLRPGRFFMVESSVVAGRRSAALRQLDPLLHEFESEYHYLFKKVYDESKTGQNDRSLERFYVMPNLARRTLEAFLSFRFPAESGELKQQLDRVSFDPAKKAKILRFLHTYSHDGKISEPEHDLSILSETPQVLAELLDLIKTEDQKHFSEMEKLIA